MPISSVSSDSFNDIFFRRFPDLRAIIGNNKLITGYSQRRNSNGCDTLEVRLRENIANGKTINRTLGFIIDLYGNVLSQNYDLSVHQNVHTVDGDWVEDRPTTIHNINNSAPQNNPIKSEQEETKEKTSKILEEKSWDPISSLEL